MPDRNDSVDEILNGDELHLLIFKHLEEMLDNPDQHGIYPTSKFMVGLKLTLHAYYTQKLQEALGEDEIKDQGFGDNAVYYKDGAPERNALRAEVRRRWHDIFPPN